MKPPKKDNPITKARLNMLALKEKKLIKKRELQLKLLAATNKQNKPTNGLTNEKAQSPVNATNSPRTFKKTHKILSILSHFRYAQSPAIKVAKPSIAGSKKNQALQDAKLDASVEVIPSWGCGGESTVTKTTIFLKKQKQKWSQRYNKKNKIQVTDALKNSMSILKKKKKTSRVKKVTILKIAHLLQNRTKLFNLDDKNTFQVFNKMTLFNVHPRSYYTLHLNSPTTLFLALPAGRDLRCSSFNDCTFTGYNTSSHLNISFLEYLKFTRTRNIKNRYLNLLKTDYKLKTLKLPSKDTSQPINQARAYYWDSFYNTLPLTSFMDKKVTVINYNIANVLFDKDFTQLLKRALRYFPFMQLNRVAAKLIASIFSILVLKDSKALSTFIQTIMQKEHYKKHNMYFGFAGQLITDVLSPWLHHFNCLGASITFRGKLAVGGNSRKRALKYKTGMLSSSSKYIKVNRTFAIVRTKTGSVGFVVTVAW